ncbi:MAG TPA: hypothetical protein VHA13_02630 [Gammaproteobacteria bacterium]|nr:hypothetical protein [Gammaproteobacteria bacterium]
MTHTRNETSSIVSPTNIEFNETPAFGFLNYSFNNQGSFISIMQALGLPTNPIGVCFGLSYSFRDAFHSDNFYGFLHHLDQINLLYQHSLNTANKIITEELLKAIQLGVSSRQTDETPITNLALVENRATNEANNIFSSNQYSISTLCSFVLDHARNPSNSLITKLTQAIFIDRLDAVLRRKIKMLEEGAIYINNPIFINEINEIKKQPTTPLKYQNVEILIKKLETHDTTNRLGNYFKFSISDINTADLNFFNQTMALFTRISIYQLPYLGQTLFNVNFNTQRGIFDLNQKLVETLELEAKGGLSSITSFAGCYTINELIRFFKTFRERFKKYNLRISLNINGSKHSIFIGYDSQNNSFILLDPNDKPIVTTSEECLARRVIAALNLRKINVLSTKPNSLSTYLNSYLAIKDTEQLLYIDYRGNVFELEVLHKTLFRTAAENILMAHGSYIAQHHLYISLEFIKQSIAANKGHEAQGDKFTLFSTDISLLNKCINEAFRRDINQWLMQDLKDIHTVTAEKAYYQDFSGLNWLRQAFATEKIQWVECLLRQQIPVSLEDISFALVLRNSALIELMLYYTDELITDIDQQNYTQLINKLKNHNIEIDRPETMMLSALQYATCIADKTAVKILLEHGADPDYSPNDIKTPQQIASENKLADICGLFTKYKMPKKQHIYYHSKINQQTLFYNKPPLRFLLMSYIEAGELAKVEAIIRQDKTSLLEKLNFTDTQSRHFEGITPLQYAIWLLDREMYLILLKNMEPSAASAQYNEHMLNISPFTHRHGIYYQAPSIIQKWEILNLKAKIDEKLNHANTSTISFAA